MIENRQAGSRASAESQAISLTTSFDAAVKRLRMYPADHPSCKTAVERPLADIQTTLAESGELVVSLQEGNLSVNGVRTELTAGSSVLAGAIEALAIKSIVIGRGVTADDLTAFLHFFASEIGKSHEWGDLQKYITAKGIEHIEVDTLRYELVGDDEKIVSSDAVLRMEGGDGIPADQVTIEFGKLVKEHPEFLIRLLSGGKSAREFARDELEGPVDLEALARDARNGMRSLSEERVLQIVAQALKNRLGSEQIATVADLEDTLFEVRSMVEKMGNLSLVPKIKRLLKELNFMDENAIDLILNGESSKKDLTFAGLESAQSAADSGTVEDEQLRSISVGLEALDDVEYTDRLAERLFRDVASSSGDEAAFESKAGIVREIVESATNDNAVQTCDSLIGSLKKELSDITVEMPHFGFLCREALTLSAWLLQHERLDDLLELLRSVRVFTSDEASYSAGVREAANEFISELGTSNTVNRFVQILNADFEKNHKTIYELLLAICTHAAALALFEYIIVDDRSMRLFVVRVLSEYGSTVIRAFQRAVSEDERLAVSQTDGVLPLETWYRVRNLLFVAGNTQAPDAVELIERYVSHSDSRVAAEVITDEGVARKAVFALGNVGGVESLPHLIQMYNQNPKMKGVLLPMVAKIGGDAAVDFLSGILLRQESYFKKIVGGKNDEKEKLAAVVALSRIKSAKAVEKLREFGRQASSGPIGIFRPTTLLKAVNQAVSRIERELTAGQNGR
jgi:hypothetical protein